MRLEIGIENARTYLGERLSETDTRNIEDDSSRRLPALKERCGETEIGPILFTFRFFKLVWQRNHVEI